MDSEDIKREIGKQIAEAIGQQQAGMIEVIIREGEALPQNEPVKINIVGIIDSPARWLEAREELQKLTDRCHVVVDRDNLSITLSINEISKFGPKITGRMQISEAFRKFHINDGHTFTLPELAMLFKMNRSFFETKQQAMSLVALLQNFKGKVNKDLESSNDNRGNKKIDFKQAVESNLPDAFVLQIPVFNGMDTEEIKCEVYVDPDDWSCQLISPDANDVIEKYRDEEINKVIERIDKAMPGVTIIEI
jgi:hypothetical protein